MTQDIMKAVDYVYNNMVAGVLGEDSTELEGEERKEFIESMTTHMFDQDEFMEFMKMAVSTLHMEPKYRHAFWYSSPVSLPFHFAPRSLWSTRLVTMAARAVYLNAIHEEHGETPDDFPEGEDRKLVELLHQVRETIFQDFQLVTSTAGGNLH